MVQRTIRKIKHIIRGWNAFISGKTPEFARKRLSICRKCNSNKWWICSECGCPLAAKTRVEEEFCDIGKW